MAITEKDLRRRMLEQGGISPDDEEDQAVLDLFETVTGLRAQLAAAEAQILVGQQAAAEHNTVIIGLRKELAECNKERSRITLMAEETLDLNDMFIKERDAAQSMLTNFMAEMKVCLKERDANSRVKVLEEALKFYASLTSKCNCDDGFQSASDKISQDNYGDKARAALANKETE